VVSDKTPVFTFSHRNRLLNDDFLTS
jgi:hypothetical protein